MVYLYSTTGKVTTYNVTPRQAHITTTAVVKAGIITYSECVFVAFSIQHEKRMRRVTLKLEHCPQISRGGNHISNLIKIRPVGTEVFFACGRKGRRKDMTKLRATFHNFAKAPKNGGVSDNRPTHHGRFRFFCAPFPFSKPSSTTNDGQNFT